jgi:hypothetical protein
MKKKGARSSCRAPKLVEGCQTMNAHKFTAASYADLKRQFREWQTLNPHAELLNEKHINEAFTIALQAENDDKPKGWKIDLTIMFREATFDLRIA